MPVDGPLETCLAIVTRRHGDRDDVLLGTKRRGFGVGRLVLPGGKIDAGETAYEAAARELHEETGLVAGHLHTAGVVDFAFPDDAQTADMRAHVVVASAVEGVAATSDEIDVMWVPLDAIPYERMWPDARLWLPRALAGELRHATFTYAADARTLDRWSLT